WIRFNIQENRGIRHHVTTGIAREDRSEIKTETIYVHLFHPIANAIQNHPANDGMIGIESVSCPAVVGVARAVLFQDVVSVVIESTKTDCDSGVVAFRCMIENNVKDYLDSRSMQSLDHVAKLVHRTQRILSRAVRLVRCEKRDRCVTPIVNEACRAILRIKLEHGKEFDSRDA